MRSFGPQVFIPILMIVRNFWAVAPGDRTRERVWAEGVLASLRRPGTGLAGALGERESMEVLESHRRMLARVTVIR